MTAPTILKKVSTKCFDGALKTARAVFADAKAKNENAMPVSLGMLFGVAHGIRIGITQFGNFTGLQGQFQASCIDGNEYIGTECFLPADYVSLITAQMGELKGDAKEKTAQNAVGFAFEILVAPSGGDLGYAYQIRPVGEFTNPMDAIRAQLKIPAVARAPEAAQLPLPDVAPAAADAVPVATDAVPVATDETQRATKKVAKGSK